MICINEKQNCSGCYACANICPKKCITMECDKEGFWYPKVDKDSCVECGLCEKICPLLHKKQIENKPIAYACFNKEESVRLKSSSGGVFTLIAEQILNNNGVVFGAGFDKEFNAVHSYVETVEALEELRGSKYVQSKIGDTYRQAENFLIQGRQVLFTGTPCQIDGIKSYLQQDYDNLFCIDFICHGVPSPKVWRKYILYQENRARAKTRRISFRNKEFGWKKFSISFLFINNTKCVQIFVNDLYMKAFLKNICLRPSCYECNYKTLHRQSDITLADAWGIQNLLPEMDDDKGTSLIFINSINGEKMFNKFKNNIKYASIDINKAVSYNIAAIESATQNTNRDKFFEELECVSFDKLVKKYCVDSVIVKIKRKIKL